MIYSGFDGRFDGFDDLHWDDTDDEWHCSMTQ